MNSDPRPVKRHRATKQEWAEIHAQFCDEVCWCCGEKWTELHHILNRSHSGDDMRENLAPVCRGCHSRIEARDPLARSLIRQALLPSTIGYLRWKLGENVEGWLSRNYPLGTYAHHALEVQDLTKQPRTTTNVGASS